MSVGIIGTGALGTGVARALAAAGIETVISNSRGPESLKDLAEQLGSSVRTVTTEEAAAADVVVVAVRWVDVERVLSPLPPWNNRIVIDATNPVAFLEPNSPDANDPSNPLAAYGIKAVALHGRHSSAVVSEKVEGARVVKAFNHLDVRTLVPKSSNGSQTVLFFSGDEPQAKSEVRALLDRAGFFPVDLGPLDVGGPLASLPFGALAGAVFTKA